jgi:predicted Zn-dependent protease
MVYSQRCNMVLRLLLAIVALGLPPFLPPSPATAAQSSEQPAPAAAETATSTADPEMSPEDRADAEIGKKAAAEVDKQYTLVEDSPHLTRIAAAIEQLRPGTEKPKQQYECKVIESDAINAFALPGGYLYYTQGLLEAVESEDELAAVTAHEMAHVCLNHARKLMGKDEQYKNVLLPVILAAVLADSESVDPGAIATVGGLVAQEALNHYGREAELEADHQAVLYLQRSKRYNPVAMLTVVEGLARLESSRPQTEMGVFQTHPYARERADAVARQLQTLGIPLERRRVIRSLVAGAGSVVVEDVEVGELRLNDRVVFQPAAAHDDLSAAARAAAYARILNTLLLEDLQLVEILAMAQDGRALLTARGEIILTILPEDAAFHDTDVQTLAKQAMTAIQKGFREEKIRRAY